MPGATSQAPTKYPHVLKAVFDTPWAITSEMLGLIAEVARFRAEGGHFSEDEIRQRIEAQTNGPRRGGQIANGVAVIPVYGVLSQRMTLMSALSGGTSVEQLTGQFRDALADPDIASIVFDIDSPGGSVDGIEEIATEVREARGAKHMVAVANTMAASAAYWIAAQADEVVATPSGQVGSIGIMAIHEDFSRAKDALGITTTFITAGKYKAEGHEDLPLSDEALAYVQDQVDEFYSMFVASVAKGRGASLAAVRGSGFGEGRIVLAKAAKAAGMVDRIETLDATVRRMARATARRGTSVGDGLARSQAYINQEAALLKQAVASAVPFDAAAIARHKTATSDDEWDGPANEARLPSGDGAGPALRKAHGWIDDDGDPDAKASYKFIHHFVSEDGSVGAASTRGCANGRAVLKGGRGGTTIPSADKPGVWNHLAGHERDAGREVDDYSAEAEHLPFSERLALVTDEATELVAHARERARLRAKEGRPGVSDTNREQLSALSASLGAIQGDIDEFLATADPETTEPSTPPAARQLHPRFDLIEALSRYPQPSSEVPTP